MADAPFIHERALVETDNIGTGTRIWAFAHVAPGARIGTGCTICDHTYIEGGVWIGDRVTVKPGVYLWEGITVGDDVFIGPRATFTNDRLPRSREPFRREETMIGAGVRIGSGAVLLPGLTIGEGAIVGPGAVVTRGVPPLTVVAGNPARVIRTIAAGDTVVAEVAPTTGS